MPDHLQPNPPPSLGKFFWQYLGGASKPAIVLALIAIPLFGLASTGMVALIGPIFDEVLQAGGEGGSYLTGLGGGEESDPESPSWTSKLNIKRIADQAYIGLKAYFGITGSDVVWFVPLLFVVVFTFRAVADFVSGYSFQIIGLDITNRIRNDLYRRLLDQSSSFHAAHPSGDLVSRIVSDVSLIQLAVTNRLLDLVRQSVTLVFLTGLLLSTHLGLALVCLTAVPLVAFLIDRFGRAIRRTSHRSQERMGVLTSLMTEGVRGHRVVQAFGMEQFEQDRFRQATNQYLKTSLRAQLLNYLSSPVIESVAAFLSAGLLIYAGYAIRQGTLTGPVLVQFIANLLLMYDPMRKLNKVNVILQHALAGAQRAREIMNLPIDVVDRPDAQSLDTVREGIRFDDVHFAYGNHHVLRGFDLEIRRGEIVALVGPSGAGKTTVISLLGRFFDPTAGRVLIDGRDLRDVKLADLREQIGVVTQDAILFNDSIRNNIGYGRADVDEERVREAARAAYADEFILRQPDGYDTTVGEGGRQLSGGQRQRLCIARALLKDAPILILDEATSHLDSESETLVQKALNNLMQSRTTILVAHRLSTAMHADRIVVLDQGRVVESGTHDELLGAGGLYRKLHDLQYKSQSEDDVAAAG